MKINGIRTAAKFDENLLNSFKQLLILFDQVGVPTIKHQLEINKNRILLNPHCQNKWVSDEIEYLLDNKLIFDSMKEGAIPLRNGDHSQMMKDFKFYQEIITKDIGTNESFEAAARLSSILLNNHKELIGKEEFIPIVPLKDNQLISPISEKTDVYKIIINQIPVPDENTPWEDILEFKDKTNNKSRLNKLRVWINNTTKLGNTPVELEQEIESIVEDFNSDLKLSKIKYSSGSLITGIIATEELIKNPNEFPLLALTTGILTIAKDTIELLKDERSSEGKELSYLIKANQKFSS